MKLEEQITRGVVTYISSIEYDSAERRLTIKFLRDPEESVIDRILTFSNVKDFSDELNWDEGEDEDCLDSLIGLDEYPEDEGTCYVVHTDKREMVFYTNENPQIEVVRLKGNLTTHSTRAELARFSFAGIECLSMLIPAALIRALDTLRVNKTTQA
jgi:hypothetical protein